MSSATAPLSGARTRGAAAPSWHERSARLFEELRGPCAGMLRRAFGSALGDAEIEDVYSNAWLGTLRTLERRQADLDDDEIRSYVFTAVAHQAAKELRRRRRKPVTSLERAEAVADGVAPPDERARQEEQSRITRDLLASLPRRRRAVLLLRYGWGLDPGQVCELIEGLSPRAYRKEITRGVDQLAERMRVLEAGDWCEDREPVLKAFAAGIADEDQQLQAQHHLAHCRHCADFVGKLTGHLHELGSSVALPGMVDIAADGRLSLPDRASELADKTRDAVGGFLSRGDAAAGEPSAALTAAAPRGAGAAGAGGLVKLAGIGLAGKAAVACVGGGALAAVCVVAGVGPVQLPHEHAASEPPSAPPRHASTPARLEGILPSQVGSAAPGEPSPSRTAGTEQPADPPPDTSSPAESQPVEEAPQPPAPPPVQQFGLAPSSSSSSTPAASESDSGSDRPNAAAQEFGP